MKNRLALALLTILAISIFSPLSVFCAGERTLTLSDSELNTQFAKVWGPGTLLSKTDIIGLGVQFNFTGLASSGTGVGDNYPISSLAGGQPDGTGGFGDFLGYTRYRLAFTNLGPNPVNINLYLNTGLGGGAIDTYWGSSWTTLGVSETKILTLDFSSADEVWNAQDDPVLEWRYPGGTSGVIVRRLDESSNIGFQVIGSGAGSIMVSATVPNDVVLSLSDVELSTQFAKESGPGTLAAVTDIPGFGVRFDFTGLDGSSGTVVGDNFPVSALAGGAWKDYGSGLSGPYDFSAYSRFSLLFINVGTIAVTVNLKMNTGWTTSPWGSSAKDTFWQNGWTPIPAGESRIVTLDFWSAEVWNAFDDPVVDWQYPDGTSGVVVRRLDEVSDIGFQILGTGDGSIMVSGDLILSLSDVELSTQFAKESGPGTLAAVTDIPGFGVRFDFTGLDGSSGTVVGDNFPVSALAGGHYKTYGVNATFSTWGDFSEYMMYRMNFTNVGSQAVTVNLKINTGWTTSPPEYAKAWRDTFWQNAWTYIAPGQSKTVTLNFSSAEVWNAADEVEYPTHSDGTTDVEVWRLDEVSDIGFQILGTGDGSIIVSSHPILPPPSEVYVDDDYNTSTPGWGYDHYAIIQDGIDAVIDGGLVKVYEGTYAEQLIINKNVALVGDPGPRIVAPDVRNSYTFPESSATWDPIIFAFGGAESGGSVSGTGTVNVTISGFEIDGANKAAAAPVRFAAILLRNANPGMISNNTIHHMYDADGEGNGPQTFGVIAYGDSSLGVHYNDIRDFSRGGIVVAGDDSALPDPYATVEHNIVFGNGLEVGSGWWAENGIQIGYGADGRVVENEVSNCKVNSASWAASGIIIYKAAHGINVLNNSIADCDIGISVSSPSFDLIDGNTVTGSTWDAIRLGWPVNNCTVSNNILTNNWAGIGIWDASNNTVVANLIESNEYGIYMDGDSHNNMIEHNQILNNLVDGIHIEPYGGFDPSKTEVHYNNITGNAVYGLFKNGTEIVNATNNWWGDSTGPYHSTSWLYLGSPYGPNPGLGDQVSDYVLYDPWTTYITLLPPTLKVEPDSYQAELLNETFDVNITINDLDVGWKCIGIEFRLRFNSTLLQIISVTEGPFMKQFPTPPNTPANATMFLYYIEEDASGGYALVGVLLMPNMSTYPPEWTNYAYGNGTIATITFKAKYQFQTKLDLTPQTLSSQLTLFETKLIDDEINDIPHELEHGYYEILPSLLGDVNFDGKVDISDIVIVIQAFGTAPSHPRWNEVTDVNNDGIVDISDIAIVIAEFGTSL